MFVKRTIRLTDKQIERLTALAETNGTSFDQLVRIAVTDALEGWDRFPKLLPVDLEFRTDEGASTIEPA